MVDELAARHHDLGRISSVDPAELTLVFDAGQNSQPNFEHLAEAGLGYIGSLPPSDHDDLLAIPISDYERIDAFDGLHAVEVGSIDARGRSHHALLTHSAQLHAGQARGLDQTLAKAERELSKIGHVLASGRGRRTHAQLTTAIGKITNKRWVRDLLTTTVTGDRPATFRLAWHIDDHARAALEQRLFGKRILITDRHTWTTTELIAGYRSQSDAEFGFRQLKDPHVVSFSPMHHWTEHNIRVHTLYCILALMIAHLMRRIAHQAGLHLSVRELLAQLAGIQETVLLYPGKRGRPKARRMITDRTELQQQLFDLFELARWDPAG
jgi:transposase